MKTIEVSLAKRSYPIYIGAGLLSKPELIVSKIVRPKAAIVTNSTVAPLYLEQLSNALQKNGIEVLPIILPDGEKYKKWETLNLIFDGLLAKYSERSTTLIAL